MLTAKTQGVAPSVHWGSPVRYLKGVGPEKEKAFSRLEVRTLGDLLRWFPRRHERRYPVKRIRELSPEGKQCVSGVVTGRGRVRFGGRSVLKVVLADETDPALGPSPALTAVFYHQTYLAQVFRPKSRVVFYGAVEKKGRRFQMVHPEFEVFGEEPPAVSPHHGRWVPVYPLTEDLTQKSLRQTLFEALSKYGDLAEEFLPLSLRLRLGLMDARQTARQIHFPEDETSLRRAHDRLVFEEFFLLQLRVESRRARLRAEHPELSHATGAQALETFLASWPFAPSQGQRQAVADIAGDMRGRRPMHRLVQGDVGSGKTAVGAAALYFTAKSGFQGALMAPTEVLAQQLYFNVSELLEPFGVTTGYLSQSTEAPVKTALRQGLEEGSVSVVIGTQALLDARVRFKRLGLVVVDEQHKFGVDQRAALRAKSEKGVHTLLMTATPIPQTLAMTLYGDMDISVMAERPAGRARVKTLCFGESERAAVHHWLGALLEEGAQAFVVCPCIGEEAGQSGRSPQAKAAQEAVQTMRARFGSQAVGFLHGRMRAEEKQKAMRDFKEGKTRLLVSTTVVEVGVDVPAARFMVIENAERFGLAQLHQLRGRVGRGAKESYCVLFCGSEDPEVLRRLETFAGTQSGFDIAEKDLALRGGGHWLGKKQHGFMKLKVGDLVRDAAWLHKAKAEARALLARDPRLAFAEHRALKRRLNEAP